MDKITLKLSYQYDDASSFTFPTYDELLEKCSSNIGCSYKNIINIDIKAFEFTIIPRYGYYYYSIARDTNGYRLAYGSGSAGTKLVIKNDGHIINQESLYGKYYYSYYGNTEKSINGKESNILSTSDGWNMTVDVYYDKDYLLDRTYTTRFNSTSNSLSVGTLEDFINPDYNLDRDNEIVYVLLKLNTYHEFYNSYNQQYFSPKATIGNEIIYDYNGSKLFMYITSSDSTNMSTIVNLNYLNAFGSTLKVYADGPFGTMNTQIAKLNGNQEYKILIFRKGNSVECYYDRSPESGQFYLPTLDDLKTKLASKLNVNKSNITDLSIDTVDFTIAKGTYKPEAYAVISTSNRLKYTDVAYNTTANTTSTLRGISNDEILALNPNDASWDNISNNRILLSIYSSESLSGTYVKANFNWWRVYYAGDSIKTTMTVYLTYTLSDGTVSHSTIKYYDGSQWKDCEVFYYTGSEWKQCDVFQYDGSEYKKIGG